MAVNNYMETKEDFGKVTFKLNLKCQGSGGRGEKWEKVQSRVYKKKKWE